MTTATYESFVETSNVKRFRDGIRALESRAAPESGFMLVTGEWGWGKSRLGLEYATKNNWPFVRIHAACTPHWVLSDLMRELGVEPKHRSEDIHGQVIQELGRTPRGMIFDEVEHALTQPKVIDTIRAIVDAIEVPCILIGRESVPRQIKRFPAVWSRVSVVCQFKKLNADDLGLLLTSRNVKVNQPLMDELLRQTEGRVRLAVSAVQRLARLSNRPGAAKTLTLDDIKGVDLVKEAILRREAESIIRAPAPDGVKEIAA